MPRLHHSWQHGINVLIGFLSSLEVIAPHQSGFTGKSIGEDILSVFAGVQILLDDDRNTGALVGMAVVGMAWMVMPVEFAV